MRARMIFFFRRLNQVKEITGLDLEDPDVMLELQLSYRII